MRAIQCANCGASNVDFDGYCWSCERQNPTAAPRPTWVDVVAVEQVTPQPKRRVSAPRWVVTVVAPPLVTVLLLGCLYTVYITLRTIHTTLAAPLAAGPAAVDGSGSPVPDPATAAGCVIGAWNLTAHEWNLDFDGYGLVHLVGNGGTATFDANGSGVYDYTGMFLTSRAYGRTFTATFSGKETFRYQVVGTTLNIDHQVGNVVGTFTIGGTSQTSAFPTTPEGSDELRCAGNMLKVTSRASPSAAENITTTASRMGT